MNDETGLLKVAAGSRSTAVAGAIAGMVRDGRPVTLQAIGAAAVNQAVKAIGIARGYLVDDGIDIACVPSFCDLEVEGSERTALRLEVVRRC